MTNSLFATGSDPLNASNKTAQIASFRHLENLDGTISSYVPGGDSVATTAVTATQTADLIWKDTDNKTGNGNNCRCGYGGRSCKRYRRYCRLPRDSRPDKRRLRCGI